MEKLELFRNEWFEGTEQFVVHTSGSTGKPKDISLHRADMIHSAEATCKYFGINQLSTLGCPLSIGYIAGKMMAVRAWVSGATFIPLEVSNTFDLPDGISFDLLCIVPSMIPNLLNHPQWAARVSNVLIGGAAVPPTLLKSLTDNGFNWRISYGMTETCSHVALAADDNIYHALPGVSFELDGRGCLVMNAPGYTWKSLTTNDAADLADAHSFFWKGRIDGVINSGGIKLFPEELELLYQPHLPDIEYVIVGRPSDRWGQEVVLVTTADSSMVRTALEQSGIPHQKLPKAIITLPSIPQTPTGKPNRPQIISELSLNMP